MLKKVSLIILPITLCTIFLFRVSTKSGKQPGHSTGNITSLPESAEQSRADVKPDTLKILGVGDIMLGSNYPTQDELPPDDGKNLLKPFASVISSADVAFGNLEGVLLSEYCKPGKPIGANSFVFKSPDHYAAYIKEAGFDVLSLANNHSGDFGDKGRNNTTTVLNKYGIHYAGLDKYPTCIFKKNNTVFGFCAFAHNRGTLNINDLNKAKSIVAHLDSVCDIVIVSFHGGAEGLKHDRITRRQEIYLNENRGNPFAFAHAVIDAGADIIFGHGPHVPRAIELYKERFIAYSLGNFSTYGKLSLKSKLGLAPLIEVSTDRKGRFFSGHIYAAVQRGEGGPVPDSNNTAINEIKRLTLADFPDGSLHINEDGLISLKGKKSQE